MNSNKHVHTPINGADRELLSLARLRVSPTAINDAYADAEGRLMRLGLIAHGHCCVFLTPKGHAVLDDTRTLDT